MHLAGLTVSLVMLKTSPFPRSTAYTGILGYALALAKYLRQALTSSVALALLLILPSALLLATWFFLVGRLLLRLASSQP
jgi:hypothetical protein